MAKEEPWIHMTRKNDGSFMPSMDEDSELVKHIKAGDTAAFPRPKRKRNYKFHQKFMVLIKMAHSNLPDVLTGYLPTVDDLRYDVTIEAGYFERKYTRTGKMYKVPKSISFAKMDETIFNKLYNDVLDKLLSDYLIGVNRKDFRTQAIRNIARHF